MNKEANQPQGAQPPLASAIKKDQGKVDLSLLSSIWIMGVGRVLSFGAKKYHAHNWRKGFQLTRVLAAALRHIFQFIGGEDLDADAACAACIKGGLVITNEGRMRRVAGLEWVCTAHSGECHLDNASCMLMFARELWETRPELDDRYKGENKPKVTENVPAPEQKRTPAACAELPETLKAMHAKGHLSSFAYEVIAKQLGLPTEPPPRV